MQVQKNEVKKSEIELTIEITPDEYQPFLNKAAIHLSKNTKIDGFRPGKAPYEIVKRRFGEMKIYEEALDEIITHFYWQAVSQEKLNTIGQPKIDLEKFAPNNPIVFKAAVALMPQVKLGDYKKIKIQRQEVKVDVQEIGKVIDDLRKMQAKEVLVERPAGKDDRVEIDFTVSLDKVVVEDGVGKQYPLVIGEGFMLPGFEEQLIGLKAGEEKEFQLKFPESYQKSIVAGKLCDFKVKMLSVYQRDLPEATNEWSKVLGAESIEDLKLRIKKNLLEEKMFHEEQRLEVEMLNKIIEQTEFSEIPDVLIDNEAQRMTHEFEDSIESQGLNFEEYLKNIKKEKKDLEEEFKPKASERVKASLVIKEIADKESITVSDEELQKETEKILAQVKDNQEAQNNIKSEGYQQYLKTVVRNRKVIEMLKSLITFE